LPVIDQCCTVSTSAFQRFALLGISRETQHD